MNDIVEQQILSCILQEPKKMVKAVSKIKPNDFQEPLNRQIYETMYKLFLEGKAIGVVSLIKNGLNDYGQELLDLQHIAVITTTFESNLQTLRELSKKRKAKVTALQLIEKLENSSIEECQGLATELLQTLGTQEKVSEATAMQGIEDFIQRMDKKPEYFNTGFDLLNKYAYIAKGDFVVIGGRPSSGKTAITLQMAYHISQTKKVVYFSCETSKDKIFDRLIAYAFNVSMDDIKRRTIDDEHKKFIKEYKEDFDSHLKVVEASGWTTAEIKAKSIEEQADIIFIDYLTLLNASGRDLYEKTTNISRDLHILAQQSNIAVVALSQLNRQGEGEPSVIALRQSGQIEQDADLIFMIWQNNNDPIMTHKLKISKNKEGELRTFGLNFDGKHQYFKFITNKDE